MLIEFCKKRLPYLLALLFILVEIGFGFYIQLGSNNVPVVSYVSVVLAFLFVIYSFKKDFSWLFTACAMVMTLCADIFLVLADPKEQVLAMVFFNFAQIFYALRLFYSQTTKTSRIVQLVIRLSLCVFSVALTFIVLGDNVNLLSVISIFYYANLLTNLVYAFLTHDYIFGVGLICFAFCDAFIGLNVLANGIFTIPEGSFLYTLLHLGFDPVWAFYLPSQTLIALSTLRHKLKNK